MKLDQTIIPSVREIKNLKIACTSSSPIILLSNTDLGNLKSQIDLVHSYNKKAFAHLELIGGFSPDSIGIKLLKNMYKLDGVFTTNIQAGGIAKKIGLDVVYRFFLIDSRSLKRANGILKNNDFDAIETLPAYCAIQEFDNFSTLGNKSNFIAGGFIKDSAMIDSIFNIGIMGVTTSEISLWN